MAAELGTIGEVDGGNGPSNKISLGASTGVQDTRVLDDSRRCDRLPISIFFLHGHWLLHLKEWVFVLPTPHSPWSLHPGSRLRAADWRLANGRHARALRVYAWLFLLFLGILPGNSSSPEGLWIAYTAAILYGTDLDGPSFA